MLIRPHAGIFYSIASASQRKSAHVLFGACGTVGNGFLALPILSKAWCRGRMLWALGVGNNSGLYEMRRSDVPDGVRAASEGVEWYGLSDRQSPGAFVEI